MMKRPVVQKSLLSLLVLLVVSLAASVSFAELSDAPSMAGDEAKPAPANAAGGEDSKGNEPKEVAVDAQEAKALLTTVDKASVDAFKVLWNATVFESAHVGYSGDLSENVKAFRVLWASPKAGELFEALGRSPSIVARLYGAAGLYRFDPAGFDVAIKNLRSDSKQRVGTLSGCIKGGESVGDILESSDPHAVRLKPGQTLIDWFKANDAAQLDLVGGGYTAEFAGSDVPARPVK